MKKRLFALLLAFTAVISIFICGCGEKEHVYGEWVVTVAPTCTESGERARKCEKCGEFEKEEIPPKGHNFVNGICTDCGALEK